MLESKKFVPDMSTFKVADVAAETIKLAQMINKKRIKIKFKLEDKKLCVRSDPGRIQQVFLSMLSTAI